MISSFINCLLSGKKELNDDEIRFRLDALGLDFVQPPFNVASIEADLSAFDYSSRDKILEELRSYVSLYLTNAIVVINEYENIQMLIYACSAEPDFENLHDRISLDCGINCFIGVGSKIEKLDKISLSSSESQRMLSFKYQYQHRGVAKSDSLQGPRYYSTIGTNESIERVVDSFLAADLPEMNLRMAELVSSIRSRQNASKSSIRRTLIELAVRIVNIAAYSYVDVDAVLGDIDIYHWIMEQNHTEIITDWIIKISTSFIENIQNADKNRNNKVIAKACRYIDNHLYSTELTLFSVSNYVGLTSSYFSTLFKDITGERFKSYIARRRIQQSMYLLENTDLKIEDIAIQTGHSRIQYFTKTFKEHVGVTPNKYRQNHQFKKRNNTANQKKV